MQLADHVALITGSARGIGRATARRLAQEVRYILGDTHYNDPAVRTLCEQTNRALVATRRGAYPHHDDGVEVRRIVHKRWSLAIEPLNGLFKNVFEWRTQMPGPRLSAAGRA